MFRRILILVLAVLLAACARPSQVPLSPAVTTRSLPQSSPTDTLAPFPTATAPQAPAQPSPTNTTVPPVAATAPVTRPAQLPSFGHVFIIVMENKEASLIVGSQSAPYVSSLARQYAYAANYYAVAHPSLPNYLALTGGSTFGKAEDCTDCFVSAPNITDQIEKAGRTWKAYIESMPAPCYLGADSALYARRHEPFIYYDSVRTDPARCRNIVPLTQLDGDLRAQKVPDFVWITPNLCNDMHNCPVSTGDNWLRTWVPRILGSSAWKNNGVLFITFDEGTTGAGCCTYAAGGKVSTLVISRLAKPGFVSQVPYDHYSLLRTIEDAWGLLPPLGNAACDCSRPMTDFFSPP